MKKIALGLASLLSILFLQGCIYSSVKLPLDTDVSVTELGNKVGKANFCLPLRAPEKFLLGCSGVLE